MNYVNEIIDLVKNKYPDQAEFQQAVSEVLTSLAPAIAQNEAIYRQNAILERLIEPDRQIQFRVGWVDDNG